MILIGYDGSVDAQTAIERAAALCPLAPATVLTVWEPLATMLAPTPAGLGTLTAIGDLGEIGEIDAEAEQAARQRAREGAERAEAAGLHATAIIAARHGSIADAILDHADRLDADAIVLGSRGLTGVRSLLLGSVSHRVVQHADRTVIVTPAPGVAADRARHRRQAEAHATA